MKPMTPVMSANIAMTIFEIMTFSSTASNNGRLQYRLLTATSLYSQLSSLLMTAHHQVPLLSPLVHSTGSPISAWTCAVTTHDT